MNTFVTTNCSLFCLIHSEKPILYNEIKLLSSCSMSRELQDTTSEIILIQSNLKMFCLLIDEKSSSSDFTPFRGISQPLLKLIIIFGYVQLYMYSDESTGFGKYMNIIS